MRPGGGHSKGADFEREIVKKLSLWASSGARQDIFWRSPGSGSRHTAVGNKDAAAHAGDICATHELGRLFCEHVIVECKSYKRWDWRGFLLTNRGELHTFWEKLSEQARNTQRFPILIAKENGQPPLVITYPIGMQVVWGGVLSGMCELHRARVTNLGRCAVGTFTDLTSLVYMDVVDRLRRDRIRRELHP